MKGGFYFAFGTKAALKRSGRDSEACFGTIQMVHKQRVQKAGEQPEDVVRLEYRSGSAAGRERFTRQHAFNCLQFCVQYLVESEEPISEGIRRRFPAHNAVASSRSFAVASRVPLARQTESVSCNRHRSTPVHGCSTKLRPTRATMRASPALLRKPWRQTRNELRAASPSDSGHSTSMSSVSLRRRNRCNGQQQLELLFRQGHVIASNTKLGVKKRDFKHRGSAARFAQTNLNEGLKDAEVARIRAQCQDRLAQRRPACISRNGVSARQCVVAASSARFGDGHRRKYLQRGHARAIGMFQRLES